MQLDPESGEVLAHEAAPADLGQALRRAEAERKSEREDAFDAALRAEKGRNRELDDIFNDASQKVDERDDESGPDNPLDERWR